MPGWMKSKPTASRRLSPGRYDRVGLPGLVLILACAAGLAEESGDEALSEAFLEFLAEWGDEQGEWQDPMAYEDPEWRVLDEKVEQTDE